MGYIIDLALILIIALFTFIGYKQGLVKSALKILSFFIAIVIALVLYKPISNIIIKNTTIDDKLKDSIMENIKIEGKEETEDSKDAEKSNVLKNNLSNKIISGANSTMEEVASAFAVKLIELCVILLLYIAARIALVFVTALADLIAKLPILKQINEIGGFIYGLVKRIVIVHVILAVIYLISPTIKSKLFDEIDNTIITKQIHINNILLKAIF